MFLKGKNERITKFYISLDVDYSAIPAYFKKVLFCLLHCIVYDTYCCLFKDNPGNYYAALSITFKSTLKVETSLFLSSSIER